MPVHNSDPIELRNILKQDSENTVIDMRHSSYPPPLQSIQNMQSPTRYPSQHSRNKSTSAAIFAEHNPVAPIVSDQAKNRLRSISIVRKPTSGRRKSTDVVFGTPINKGHVNYLLMYDMLTGIRISISRATLKAFRGGALPEAAFKEAHKLAFDSDGNELTPHSEYDFKFKDYAPMVFRGIREFFHVDSHEYLSSLTGKYILSELASTGKSGSFFYYSRDYRFIIKTIHDSEHKVLLQMLKNYYQHVQSNPHTLLSRIFGLHRVKRPGNKKIHFVVMANVFPIHKDIHEVFDLKGSLLGRSISEEEVVKSPQAVMKDLNWLEKGKSIRLGPEKGEIFMIQLERDVDFLKANKIMDYSLLIGIHDIIKGNADDIRNNTLSLFHPSASTSLLQRGIGSVAKAMRVTMAGISSPNISESIPLERKFCVFYEDEGGFRATDPHNIPLDEIYYLGLIDIFTKYGIKKRLETFIKSMGLDKKKISAVNPVYYADRFLRFVTKSIKGCEHKPIPAEAIFTNSLLDHKASGNLPAAVLRSKRALNHSTSDVG